MACDSSFIGKSEGVLKVTLCHIYVKSGIILELVQGRDVVTTGH